MAQEQAPPAERMAVSPPPSERERQDFPQYWRELADRLFPLWTLASDPAAPTIRFDPNQVHWTWGRHVDVTFAATLMENAIRWEEEWPDQKTTDQPIAAFLAFGAPDEMASTFVASDLREAIRARNPARWQALLDEAAALRRGDYTRTGAFVWGWGPEADGYDAILSGDRISWNWHGPKDFGNTIGQSVVDFVACGPDEKNTPDGLAWEMFDAIRARDPGHWHALLAQARAGTRAAEQFKAEQPETSPARSAVWGSGAVDTGGANTPDEAASYEEPTSLGALLVQGFAVIAASAAVALALATVLPTAAKFVSIILPVLFGFAAMFRWGSMALIVAGFFAIVAGFGSQIAYERYAELSRGEAVTLASIADAPRHPEATRFVVEDARAVPALAGHARRTIIQRSNQGPSPRVVSLQAVPLVPAGWTRSQPVPAWLTCSTTPGFDCRSQIEGDVRRTVRVRDYEVDHYREAIADARRRHNVASAEGAPILEVSSDPVGAPAFYLAGAAVVPLIVFALWALSILAWRLWRRVRRTGSAAAT